MARYIDADRFEQERAYLRAHLTFPDGTGSLGYCAVLTSVQIKDAPTEDVVPVVHAHWIHGQNCAPYCSECSEDCLFDGSGFIELSDYCPWCGAKMDEEV